ncbi:TBP interacting protein, partial [Reticulomyxa filosa]
FFLKFLIKKKKKKIKQNRPWNVKSIVDSLGGKVTKTEAERGCEALVEKGTLCCKKFGKNANVCIYWYNQDKIGQPNDDEDEGLGGDDDRKGNKAEDATSLDDLQSSLEALKVKHSALQSEYNTLIRTPTDSELKKQLTEKKDQFDSLDTLLKEKSEANNEKTVKASPEEIKQAKLDFYKYAKAWKERKDICHQMIENIWDNKKIKDVIHNTLGGDCDEDFGAKWEDYKDLFKNVTMLHQREFHGLKKKIK